MLVVIDVIFCFFFAYPKHVMTEILHWGYLYAFFIRIFAQVSQDAVGMEIYTRFYLQSKFSSYFSL